jgi:hypothetical protein
MSSIMMYAAAGLTLIWGVAHLFATMGVVKGFGELTEANRRIITMEWLVEGVALISAGAVVAAVTAVDPASPAASAAYAVVVATLIALAIVSLFTGFKVRFLPFKLCPIIFGFSAALIVLGAWL